MREILRDVLREILRDVLATCRASRPHLPETGKSHGYRQYLWETVGLGQFEGRLPADARRLRIRRRLRLWRRASARSSIRAPSPPAQAVIRSQRLAAQAASPARPNSRLTRFTKAGEDRVEARQRASQDQAENPDHNVKGAGPAVDRIEAKQITGQFRCPEFRVDQQTGEPEQDKEAPGYGCVKAGVGAPLHPAHCHRNGGGGEGARPAAGTKGPSRLPR